MAEERREKNMRLKLTWRINQRDVDLMVNSNQRICDTIKILYESGYLDVLEADNIQFVKSHRNLRNINVRLTYENGMIYSGDIIEIIDK